MATRGTCIVPSGKTVEQECFDASRLGCLINLHDSCVRLGRKQPQTAGNAERSEEGNKFIPGCLSRDGIGIGSVVLYSDLTPAENNPDWQIR